MSKKLNPEELIYRKLSLQFGLSETVIKEICHSQYEFTSKKINELNLKELTDEEISDLKTNFRFRGLGSLYVSEKLLINRKNIKNKKDENKS